MSGASNTPRAHLPKAATHGDGAIIALGFSTGEGGKEISRSKVRRNWQLSVDGKVHEIHFTNSMTSGMKRVFVDEQLKHESQVFISPNFKYKWRIGAHRLSIVPVKEEAESDSPLSVMKSFAFNQVDCTFELLINGKPFESFTRRTPQAQRPPAPRQPVLPAGFQETQAIVPPGAVPGQKLALRTPTGEMVEVAVPPGYAPGQAFTFAFRPMSQEQLQQLQLQQQNQQLQQQNQQLQQQQQQENSRVAQQPSESLRQRSVTPPRVRESEEIHRRGHSGSKKSNGKRAADQKGRNLVSQEEYGSFMDSDASSKENSEPQKEYGNMMESDDSSKEDEEEGDGFSNPPSKSNAWKGSASPCEKSTNSGSWESSWPTASTHPAQSATSSVKKNKKKRSSHKATESDPWDNSWSSDAFVGFGTVPTPTKSMSKHDANVSSSPVDSCWTTALPSADQKPSSPPACSSKMAAGQPETTKQASDPWGEAPDKSFKSLQKPSDPPGFSAEPAADPWGSMSAVRSMPGSWPTFNLPPAASSPQDSDAGVPLDPWGCIGTPASIERTSSTSSSAPPADFWSTGMSPAAAAGNAPVAEVPCSAQKLLADPWAAMPSPPAATMPTRQAADFWAAPVQAGFPDPWGSQSASASVPASLSDPWASASSVSSGQWPAAMEIAVR